MATGRPRKDIDKSNFEKLCGLFCTLDEIAGFFDCSEDTIERWCKREYKQSFAEISAKKRGLGKISLRRSGLELAKKNAAVHIFYCKNYLGMTDGVTVDVDTNNGKLADLIDGLKEPCTDDLYAETESINEPMADEPPETN